MSLYTSGHSTVNGKIGTDNDMPGDILVDPNGNYILLIHWYKNSYPYDAAEIVTYINKTLPFGSWDVYYGSNAYAYPMAFVNGGTYVMFNNLHKDVSGKILVNGEDDGSTTYSIIGSLNNPSCTSWSNYENKHTTVTNATKANGFSVYPNPAQNELNISLPTNGAYTCRIMNSLGQLMASQNISDGKQAAHINIASLAAGQYYVQLQQENKTIGTTAFVKE